MVVLSLPLNEVVDLYEKMSRFSDEEIEQYVNLAVEKGLTFDPDYLRFILKDIQGSK